MKNAVQVSVVFGIAGLLSIGPCAVAQPSAGDRDHAGRAVFEQNCAQCHGNPEVARAHTLEALQLMNAAALQYALTEGLMATQGAALTVEQRNQVIDYLAAPEGTDAWVAGMLCAAERRQVDLEQPASLTRVGVDSNNTRAMTAAQAGLSRADMPQLELAWALGFPGTGQLRAAPVIVGDTVFYAATGTDKVLALEAATGCLRWVYDSPNRLRGSLTYGELGANGPHAIVFGDGTGMVHALEAATGRLIWLRNGRADGNPGQITGAVVIHEDRIIVPISASGVGAASNPEFECCEGHGAVTALDAVTGDKLWEYHTMPPAQYTGLTSDIGVRLRGPSGAPIWSTPLVDSKRNSIYVTTGENTSHPATNTSDAIIALDLDTGEEKWVFQALALDVWNMACGSRRGPNCPTQAESVLLDHDFGGSAVMVRDVDGRDLLLAGQKSGDLWAVNPDDGSVVWNRKVGQGTALGGNHWGTATDGRRVFHAINDPGIGNNRDLRPGMYAFFVDSGESSWSHAAVADCAAGRAERVNQCDRRFGFSATPLLVDGALISAGIDGRLYIFAADSGDLLFQYDTVQEYATSNGVAGKGGSIDSHSIAAGAGMVFVGSGYGAFSQTPGNVLLAFRPRNR